jgi:4-hydroxy-tetrahydrodipicolinate synthase
MARVTSTYVCTLTMFGEGGAFDEAGQRRLFQRIASAGVGVYAGSGSPGEGFSLEPKEVSRLLEIACEEVKGKAPVRAQGVEPRSAADMQRFIKIAEATGVEAIQIYSPDMGHGMYPTDAELEAYFRSCIESTTVPVVLSSHFLNNYNIPLDLVDRLIGDYDHLVGINCTATINHLSELIDVVAGRVEVHVGGPMLAIDALALGANGFLTAQGNVAPRLCAAVIRGYDAGDSAAMMDTFARLTKLFAATKSPTGPAGRATSSVRWLKTALKVMGEPGWHVRPPHLPLDSSWEHDIAAVLDRLDIPATEGLATHLANV